MDRKSDDVNPLVTSLALDDPDRIYGQPHTTTKVRSLDHVDQWGRRYVERSPSCVIHCRKWSWTS